MAVPADRRSTAWHHSYLRLMIDGCQRSSSHSIPRTSHSAKRWLNDGMTWRRSLCLPSQFVGLPSGGRRRICKILEGWNVGVHGRIRAGDTREAHIEAALQGERDQGRLRDGALLALARSNLRTAKPQTDGVRAFFRPA